MSFKDRGTRGGRTSVDLAIVVDDAAPDVVGARAGEHAAGRLFWVEVLGVGARLRRVGAEHLLELVDLDAGALDDLDVADAGDDGVVDLEVDTDAGQ